MVNVKYVYGRADELVKMYATHDPFELCEDLHINIKYKDLGNSLKAFYFYQSRIKNIVINSRILEPMQKVLCAHELGHAILHGKTTTKAFREIELFDSALPAECEANLFAAEVLIDDHELLELFSYSDASFFNIAKQLYVPAELLDFKLRILQHKGYKFNSPIISRSDFLKNDMSEYFIVDNE